MYDQSPLTAIYFAAVSEWVMRLVTVGAGAGSASHVDMESFGQLYTLLNRQSTFTDMDMAVGDFFKLAKKSEAELNLFSANTQAVHADIVRVYFVERLLQVCHPCNLSPFLIPALL